MTTVAKIFFVRLKLNDEEYPRFPDLVGYMLTTDHGVIVWIEPGEFS